MAEAEAVAGANVPELVHLGPWAVVEERDRPLVAAAEVEQDPPSVAAVVGRDLLAARFNDLLHVRPWVTPAVVVRLRCRPDHRCRKLLAQGWAEPEFLRPLTGQHRWEDARIQVRDSQLGEIVLTLPCRVPHDPLRVPLEIHFREVEVGLISTPAIVQALVDFDLMVDRGNRVIVAHRLVPEQGGRRQGEDLKLGDDLDKATDQQSADAPVKVIGLKSEDVLDRVIVRAWVDALAQVIDLKWEDAPDKVYGQELVDALNKVTVQEWVDVLVKEIDHQSGDVPVKVIGLKLADAPDKVNGQEPVDAQVSWIVLTSGTVQEAEDDQGKGNDRSSVVIDQGSTDREMVDPAVDGLEMVDLALDVPAMADREMDGRALVVRVTEETEMIGGIGIVTPIVTTASALDQVGIIQIGIDQIGDGVAVTTGVTIGHTMV